MIFKIDHNSQMPLYKQLVASVKDAIRTGSLCSGDAMPSLNEFASSYGISMETTKKAYNILKKEGILSGHQGKGYFIDIRKSDAPIRILMLLDKLSAYKLAIHKGLADNLQRSADITIITHNQNIDIFDKMVSDTAGQYDYYLVAAHFPREIKNAKVARILKRIPNYKLILIDKDVPDIKGNIGRAFQDFAKDAANALEGNIELIREYDKTIILPTQNSLYSYLMCPNIKKVFQQNSIRCKIETQFDFAAMQKGTLFIVLGGQLDTTHFTILREATAKHFVLGQDIGIISYNDEPVNEFICGGLACLSSDFVQMGRDAALMINEGKMYSVHTPFNLIIRATL